MPKQDKEIRQRRSYAALVGEPDLVFKLSISASEFIARLNAKSQSEDNSHLIDLSKYGSMDYFVRRNLPAILNPFQVGMFLRIYAKTDGTELAECRWRLNPNWDSTVRVMFFVAFAGAAKFTVEHPGPSAFAASSLACVFCIIGFVGLLSGFIVHLAKVFDQNDMHDMEFLMTQIQEAAKIDSIKRKPDDQYHD